MVHISCLILLLLTTIQGGHAIDLFNNHGLYRDGPLPSVGAMMINQLTNNLGDASGIPVPLARALVSERIQAPVMRAMISRYLMQERQRNENENLLRHLNMFRLIGSQVGQKVLERAVAMEEDARIYNFATYFNCECALEYTGQHGEMKGFTGDLLRAVCKEAGKKCTYQYADYSRCMSHGRGDLTSLGIGLLSRQFDACLSWFRNSQRELSVAFSDPYWVYDNSAMFVIKKGNPDKFDPENIAGKKIGFMAGIASDMKCLLTADRDIGAESIATEVYYDSRPKMYKGFKDGEVDALFLLRISAGASKDLGDFDLIGKPIKCGKSGELHAMTRKDNTLPWFNDALRKMKENGQYYALCRQAEQEHGHMGEVGCV